MTTDTATPDLDDYEADAQQAQRPEGGQAPIQNLRDGTITAAIWRNEREEGLPLYAVTLTRSYRDEEGRWHDVRSFGGLDLLTLPPEPSPA